MTRKRSSPRSPLGNSGATPKALRSSGCSLPRRLAKNSAKPIPSRSHNLCGTVLGRLRDLTSQESTRFRPANHPPINPVLTPVLFLCAPDLRGPAIARLEHLLGRNAPLHL